MRPQAKKITTAAVCTALAVIMCVATVYLPLSFMPLYLAAFCIFLACKRAGKLYGVLCAVATSGIMFAMSGLSVKWFTLVLMFAPYGIVTSFTDRFTYFGVRSAILRALVAIAYFNLTFGAVFLIATHVATVGLDIPVLDWVDKLGGYPVFALVATVILVPLDVVFTSVSVIILKRLPAVESDKDKFYGKQDNAGITHENGKSYDLFGYEVDGETDGEDGDSTPPDA